MVNTGKPSRGCYMCRARRIKCDEGKPGCMRCQKSKRICPGYRDAFELKLRDESKSTKKKQNRRINQQLADSSYTNTSEGYYGPNVASGFVGSHSRNSSLSSVGSQMTSTYPHKHNVIAANMTTPIQQQAACYFLSNFVLVPEAGTMRGYLDFVLPLLRQKTPQTSLKYAFSAVTLAAMGTRPNSKALASTADLWYLKALKEINSALKDPALASSDATLASVMLMASFEQLTPSRMKPGSWTSHLDGAVAMIKSCPIERWQTGIGRDLFIAVRAHMTLQCIANSNPVDTDVDWLGVEAYDDIVQSFATVNLKMAALRSDNDKTTTLKTYSAENIEKVLSLLRRAEAVDQEYVAWIKALPASWAIKTVSWIDGEVPDLENSIIHPGRVDAYGELWMAYKYNIVRSCRLFVWTVILRCIAWLGNPQDYRLTPEYTTASRICQQLIEDIVSSVPYFFGWNRDKDPAMVDKTNYACGATDYTTVRPLTGIFVMWPLFAAATSDFATSSQRIFLRGRLKYVAEMMGINQALILFQAQLVHPSLYIARERMNLTPAPCKLTEIRIKDLPKSPPQVVRDLPSFQGGMRRAEPIKPKEQTWTARATTPPDRPWNIAASNPTREDWSVLASTSAIQDPAWQALTPPQDQLWQPISPPQDHQQLWSASTATSSPQNEIWKTNSPIQTYDRFWASPPPESSQPKINPNNNTQLLTHNQIYSLSLSVPQDRLWQQQQPPTTQGLSLNSKDSLPTNDPNQIPSWRPTGYGDEDSAPNWMPQVFGNHGIELGDFLSDHNKENEHENEGHVMDGENSQSKEVGVGSYGGA